MVLQGLRTDTNVNQIAKWIQIQHSNYSTCAENDPHCFLICVSGEKTFYPPSLEEKRVDQSVDLKITSQCQAHAF